MNLESLKNYPIATPAETKAGLDRIFEAKQSISSGQREAIRQLLSICIFRKKAEEDDLVIEIPAFISAEKANQLLPFIEVVSDEDILQRVGLECEGFLRSIITLINIRKTNLSQQEKRKLAKTVQDDMRENAIDERIVGIVCHLIDAYSSAEIISDGYYRLSMPELEDLTGLLKRNIRRRLSVLNEEDIQKLATIQGLDFFADLLLQIHNDSCDEGKSSSTENLVANLQPVLGDEPKCNVSCGKKHKKKTRPLEKIQTEQNEHSFCYDSSVPYWLNYLRWREELTLEEARQIAVAAGVCIVEESSTIDRWVIASIDPDDPAGELEYGVMRMHPDTVMEDLRMLIEEDGYESQINPWLTEYDPQAANRMFSQS